MMANGLIIRCMEMEHIDGEMAENTKENTHLIKNMGEEYTTGQMEGDLKGFGIMVREKDVENIF